MTASVRITVRVARALEKPSVQSETPRGKRVKRKVSSWVLDMGDPYVVCKRIRELESAITAKIVEVNRRYSPKLKELYRLGNMEELRKVQKRRAEELNAFNKESFEAHKDGLSKEARMKEWQESEPNKALFDKLNSEGRLKIMYGCPCVLVGKTWVPLRVGDGVLLSLEFAEEPLSVRTELILNYHRQHNPISPTH